MGWLRWAIMLRLGDWSITLQCRLQAFSRGQIPTAQLDPSSKCKLFRVVNLLSLESPNNHNKKF